MNDLDLPAEAPPVPPRSESQEELFIETEQILNHTPPDQPSDFEEVFFFFDLHAYRIWFYEFCISAMYGLLQNKSFIFKNFI